MEKPTKAESAAGAENFVKAEKDFQAQDAGMPQKGQGKMPVRRVGSVTLGICLVGYGLLFLAHDVFRLPYRFICRIWPVLLILLGAEILAASFFYKDSRIRLDFFSFLMIFLTISFALCIGMLDYGFRHGFWYM